jgi:protein TonB
MKRVFKGLRKKLAVSMSSATRVGAWHPRCIFIHRDFLCPRGPAMKLRVATIGLGLAMLLFSAAAIAPQALAQESAAEIAKRKVRTRVAPDYPPLAKQMKVTGKVKLEATISADGRVTSTRVVGGSPVLVNSAIDALKKWRFEPAAKENTEIVEFDFN